jgi:hypothetical protein
VLVRVVVYENAELLERAVVELNGTEIDGRAIFVRKVIFELFFIFNYYYLFPLLLSSFSFFFLFLLSIPFPLLLVH